MAHPYKRPATLKYQAGLYDHMLQDSERVLVPDFADIQYAVRRALDGKMGERRVRTEELW